MIGIVLCLIVSIIVLLSHSSDASFILFHHNYNQKQQKCRVSFFSSNLQLNAIKSPFDEERGTGTTITAEDNSSSYTRTDPVEMQEEILDLTLENVELVLDEMRPYLIQVCFHFFLLFAYIYIYILYLYTILLTALPMFSLPYVLYYRMEGMLKYKTLMVQ